MTTTLMLRPPGVIQDLISILLDSPVSSENTLVRWGILPELPTQRERVYLIGVTDYLLEPNTPAHRVRREDFGVRGLIEVHHRSADGPEQASTRAWELLAGLDEALHSEQSLSNGARYAGALAVTADQVAAAVNNDGWVAQILFTLAMISVR